MLNFEQSFTKIQNYNNQKDTFLKVFFCFFPVITFLDIIRAQISEMSLLQLIPGFYFILVFFFLGILLVFTNLLTGYLSYQDNKKEHGTKTKTKIKYSKNLKQSFSFFFFTFSLATILFFPLSLDSFNSYGEKTLENLWSLNEVLNLEAILLLLVTTLSQFPIFFLVYVNLEKDNQAFPTFWKALSFFSFLLAGIITPTIDIATQLIFASSTIFFYFLILYFLQKRLKLRSSENLSFQ